MKIMMPMTTVNLSENFKRIHGIKIDDPVVILNHSTYRGNYTYRILNKSGFSVLNRDLPANAFDLSTANPPVLNDNEKPNNDRKDATNMFNLKEKLTVRKDIGRKDLYVPYSINSEMIEFKGSKVTIASVLHNKTGTEGVGIEIEEDGKRFLWDLTLFDEYNKMNSCDNKTINIFVMPNGKTQARVTSNGKIVDVIDTSITPDKLIEYIKGADNVEENTK